MKKKARKYKQATIPETDTALSKAVDDFIDNKVELAELKIQQIELEEKILIEMKKEGRDMLAISHDGETYTFEIIPGTDKLRVAKTTKTPEAEGQQELAGVES